MKRKAKIRLTVAWTRVLNETRNPPRYRPGLADACLLFNSVEKKSHGALAKAAACDGREEVPEVGR